MKRSPIVRISRELDDELLMIMREIGICNKVDASRIAARRLKKRKRIEFNFV